MCAGTSVARLTEPDLASGAQANVVASLLKGYNPNLSPLFQQPTFSPPLSQQFTIQPIATQAGQTDNKIIDNKLGRRLLQDNLAVRSSFQPCTAQVTRWCCV